MLVNVSRALLQAHNTLRTVKRKLFYWELWQFYENKI